MSITIYHNPRCSKSRATLQLLRDRGIEPRIIEYLRTPLSAAELRDLAAALGVAARALLRSGEPEYRDLGLADDALGETQILEALATHPKLLQRPIVVAGGKARIGRPPERVLEILP
jgi:arsenate reductase